MSVIYRIGRSVLEFLTVGSATAFFCVVFASQSGSFREFAFRAMLFMVFAVTFFGIVLPTKVKTYRNEGVHMRILAILVLIIATFHNPQSVTDSFYLFVRNVVCFTLWFNIGRKIYYDDDEDIKGIYYIRACMIGIFVVYNPFIPFDFEVETWHNINKVAIGVFIFSLLFKFEKWEYLRD